MKAYYRYKIRGYSKCIHIQELDNWYYIVDDMTDNKYFSISDIENAIGCKLSKIDGVVFNSIILH